MTRKAPLKSKETIEAADEERVSASAEATKPAVASSEVADEDDLQEPPQLQIDLNQELSVSDEEEPVESKKEDEMDVEKTMSEATRV